MAADRTRRTVVTSCLANAIEWYDFAIYGAMAPLLVDALLPPDAGADGLVAVYAVFATSFLARPVGAITMGVHADRYGRRSTLAAMILLMSGATAAIGLLPSWSFAGTAAPLMLVLLRLVQGFASGGQLSPSLTYLLESGTRRRWGRLAGWHTATIALGVAAGLAVAGATSAGLSETSLAVWGWRLPFLLALPLGLVGLYLRFRLDETVPFDSSEHEPQPTRAVILSHGPAILTGFALVAVLAGTFNMWFVFLPAHLASQGMHDLSTAVGCAAVGLLVVAAAAPVCGSLSDRVGRRPMLVAGTMGLCVLPVPLYAAATHGSVLLLLISDAVMGMALSTLVVGAFLAERLPVSVRATGIAVSAGWATALVGGTAPLLGSLMVRAGAPLGIPLLIVALSVTALLVLVRAAEKDPRAGLPPSGSPVYPPRV